MSRDAAVFCIRCGRSFDAAGGGDELCPECGNLEGLSDREQADSSSRAPLSGRRFDSDEEVPAEWHEGDLVSGLYEVRGLLGKGGFGNVYRVHHAGWNLDLAVKSPLPRALEAAGGVDDFVREAEDWVDLGLHPHIVTCHYVRTLGGIPRVFAECVEGGSLSDWIRDGRLYEGGPERALTRILDVAIQFAWGLGYAHEKGLIHQDVKPANVLLTPEGTVKVADFGLSRGRVVEDMVVPDGAGSTVVVRGSGITPAYCSPEQAGGEALTRRTDIWSWGLSVLEMFSGGAFWIRPEDPLLAVGQLAPQALAHYLEHGAEDEQIPAMPDGLAELLGRCFQADPAERPGDFEQIATVISLVFAEETGQAYRRERPEAVELLAGGLNNRALSLFDLGRPDEAVQLFDSALEVDPLHVEATYNKGLQLWRSSRLTDDALVDQLEEIRKAHQDDWRGGYYLGLVHLERGDAESAVKMLEEAAALAPGQTEVRRALEEALELPVAEVAHLDKYGMYGPIESLAISPDGASALSACSRPDVGSQPIKIEHMLCLWDMATLRLVRTLRGHTDLVTSVAITPDGRMALSGSHDKTLRLWELSTGRCVRVLAGHRYEVLTVAISPDGRLALSAGDEPPRLWELSTGRCLRVFEGDRTKDRVKAVAFSPDGKLGLSGGAEALRLWELESGRCVAAFDGPVRVFVVSPDGLFALCGGGSTLRLLEVETGRCVWTFEDSKGRFGSIAMSRDGRFALTSSSVLRHWALATGRCVRTLDWGAKLAIAPDGKRALTARFSGLDLREIRDVGRPAAWAIAIPHSAELLAEAGAEVLAATREARLNLDRSSGSSGSAAAVAVTRARSVPGYERDPALMDLWRETGRLGRSRTLSDAWIVERYRGHSSKITALAVTGDGRSVLSGSRDGTLHLWDLETGQCTMSWRCACRGSDDPEAIRHAADHSREGGTVDWSGFPLHQAAVTSITIHPDKKFALTGSKDNTLRLWELASGRYVRSFEGHEAAVRKVVFSPDGRFACSGGDDRTLRVWELASGRCVRCLHVDGLVLQALAISPDGCSVATGFGMTTSRSPSTSLSVWELASGRCVLTLEHDDPESVAIAADGLSAVSKSSAGTIRVWDLASGNCVRASDVQGKLRFKSCPISISPDGRFALSSGHESSCLLELSSGRCVHEFPSPADLIAFGLDGRFVLSAGTSLWSGELDWDYEFPEPADWDEGARAYLEVFLTLHTPYAGELPRDREPTEQEAQIALTRAGTPTWTEEDFQQLMTELGYRGYGWLRSEGVREKLAELARSRHE